MPESIEIPMRRAVQHVVVLSLKTEILPHLQGLYQGTRKPLRQKRLTHGNQAFFYEWYAKRYADLCVLFHDLLHHPERYSQLIDTVIALRPIRLRQHLFLEQQKNCLADFLQQVRQGGAGEASRQPVYFFFFLQAIRHLLLIAAEYPLAAIFGFSFEHELNAWNQKTQLLATSANAVPLLTIEQVRAGLSWPLGLHPDKKCQNTLINKMTFQFLSHTMSRYLQVDDVVYPFFTEGLSTAQWGIVRDHFFQPVVTSWRSGHLVTQRIEGPIEAQTTPHKAPSLVWAEDFRHRILPFLDYTFQTASERKRLILFLHHFFQQYHLVYNNLQNLLLKSMIKVICQPAWTVDQKQAKLLQLIRSQTKMMDSKT